jgi:hypothetical protein
MEAHLGSLLRHKQLLHLPRFPAEISDTVGSFDNMLESTVMVNDTTQYSMNVESIQIERRMGTQ